MDKDQIELDQDQINNIAKWDQFFKDARLGRLVRKLSNTEYILSPVQVYQNNNGKLDHIATCWTVQQWIDGKPEDITEPHNSPEQALLAAGITED